MNEGSPSPMQTPGQTPGITTATPSLTPEPVQGITWEKVDAAMQYFEQLDVLGLSSFVVNKAIEKGPKDIYNEAGPVRFQVSQAKQRFMELSSIYAESLESKQQAILALERINARKRWTRGDEMETAETAETADIADPVEAS